MPLFFLLSGFSCTLGYGRKKHQINNEENNTFDSGSFYFGRISRILPVYYFCYFYSLPVIPLGKNSSNRGLTVIEMFFHIKVRRKKICQDFCPQYTGQKSCQVFVCILGETMTS